MELNQDAFAGRVECPTFSGAMVCYHAIRGQVYMLVYHKDIHCPILANHLMFPMQSQMAGVMIIDLPKFLAYYPEEKTYDIISNDALNPNKHLIILLVFKGELYILHKASQEKVRIRMS